MSSKMKRNVRRLPLVARVEADEPMQELRLVPAQGQPARTQELPEARKVSGWPKICKLAHALLWEYNNYCKWLMLAQLLDQRGVFLT
jgi:hypothetical protein